jgi:AcrR family transcriptional regulator
MNKKQGEIIKSGRALFWKHGFRRVSVEEICKAAAVSKMTFYRYYPDKTTLAKAVYDAEVEKSLLQFKEIMNSASTAAEKMENLLKMKSEAVNDISQEFLNDFYADESYGLKQYIAEKTASSWEEIVNDYKAAQERGDFRNDFKPEVFLYLSQKFAELLNDAYFMQLCGGPQEAVMEMTKFFTYGISPYPCKE